MIIIIGTILFVATLQDRIKPLTAQYTIQARTPKNLMISSRNHHYTQSQKLQIKEKFNTLPCPLVTS